MPEEYEFVYRVIIIDENNKPEIVYGSLIAHTYMEAMQTLVTTYTDDMLEVKLFPNSPASTVEYSIEEYNRKVKEVEEDRKQR
jgi:hypothetical protein